MVDLRTVGFVVGVILLGVAAMMLLPLGVSYYYGDGDFSAIVISIVVTVVAGGGLMLFRREGYDLSMRGGFAVVTFGWLAMGLAGALPFVISGAIPSFTDAVFESMSGFTTTGASILGSHNPIEDLPHGILFWRSLTHWIGGMGIILLSLAILPMLRVGGMQLFRAEVPGPTKDKITPRIKDTAEILWAVYVGISLAEILMLMLGGMDLFDASCHTFGTLATGGFSTRSDSIAAFNSRYIEYVIILFMFIAGTNFALHYRALFRGEIKGYWKSKEFRLYLAITGIFTFLLLASNLIRGQYHNIEAAFRSSAFQTVSILTTTGYGSADWEQWGGFSIMLLIILMVIGGMAGSTGGGVKVVRIQVMLAQLSIELKRLIHPQAIIPVRIGKTIIKDTIVRNVLTFLLVFCLLLVFSTLILTLLGMDLETAFGASIASLANIGPGIGDVGPMDNYGWCPISAKWLLVLLMMLGRLEIFTVIVLFSPHFWKK